MNTVNNLLCILLSLIYVGITISLHISIKKKYGDFFSRKILHILTGNVILIPLLLGADLWAVVLPSVFFLITNLVLCKIGFWKEGEGIINYNISMIIMSIIGYTVDLIYFIVPIFIMTYGDGLAALVGHEIFHSTQKSRQGSLTMLTISFLISFMFFNWWQSLFIALVATNVEGSKWDNLTVPLTVAGIIFLFSLI